MLLPLVENAFKHISHFKEAAENKIHILIKDEKQNFTVHIFNTYDESESKHLLQSGGLGVQNVKRRLDLLYPVAHEFIVNQQDHTFTTILKIKYND